MKTKIWGKTGEGHPQPIVPQGHTIQNTQNNVFIRRTGASKSEPGTWCPGMPTSVEKKKAYCKKERTPRTAPPCPILYLPDYPWRAQPDRINYPPSYIFSFLVYPLRIPGVEKVNLRRGCSQVSWAVTGPHLTALYTAPPLHHHYFFCSRVHKNQVLQDEF